MTHRGTLRISRELVDHPLFVGDAFDKRSAWLWLLSEAAWANYRKTANGIVLDLMRGELAVSERYLAQRWQWDKSKVRRFLEKLAAEGMIDHRVVSGTIRNSAITVIRISNFDHWQGTAGKVTDATNQPSYLLVNHPSLPETSSGQEVSVGSGAQPNHHRTTPLVENEPPTEPPPVARNGCGTGLFVVSDNASEPPTEPPQSARPNQKHNQKKERTILPFSNPKGRANASSSPTSSTEEWPDDAFEQWYRLYPKKVDRLDAVRAFGKMRARGDVSFADLLARTTQFGNLERAEWAGGKDEKFTKAPAVWLNKGSYLDETCALPASEPERDAGTFTEADWLQRLAHFEKLASGQGIGDHSLDSRVAVRRNTCSVSRSRHEAAVRLAPVRSAAGAVVHANRPRLSGSAWL